MRNQAIENCAKLMAIAYRNDDEHAMLQYISKLRIITDRSNDKSASVIRELVNQEVKF